MHTPRSSTPVGFRQLPGGGIINQNPVLSLKTFMDRPVKAPPTQPLVNESEPITVPEQSAVVEIPKEEPVLEAPPEQPQSDVVYIPIPRKLACIAGVATPIILVLQAGMTGYDLYVKHTSGTTQAS